MTLKYSKLRCGPDVTDVVMNFFNKESQNPVIGRILEMLDSPDPIQQSNAYLLFAQQVRPGGVWDMKIYWVDAQERSKIFTAHCPKGSKCRQSLTFIGRCVRRDTIGNIFYGFIGRLCGIDKGWLEFGASFAQQLFSGHPDPFEDTASVDVGIDIHDNLPTDGLVTEQLLEQYLSRRLVVEMLSPECEPCSGKWNNQLK